MKEARHKRQILVDPTYIKISRMGKFLEIEGRREFTKGCREKGLGKLLFNGYRVTVWGDKKYFRAT